MSTQFLSAKFKVSFFLISWAIVAFGQPAWSSAAALAACVGGYALIFRVLIAIEKWKQRFVVGAIWFATIQLFQLSWTLSHPFLYIILPWLLISLIMGLQFGLISALITRQSVTKWPQMLAICSIWVLCEWSRLFFLSGYAFNPIGMALAANSYSLQAASLAGVYGLSFLVLLTNLALLRLFLLPFKWRRVAGWAAIALFPFLYGEVQVKQHEKMVEDSVAFNTLLVQTAFPVAESLSLESPQGYFDHAFGKWKQIYAISSKHKGKPLDLLALPEFAVPFGAYSFVYGYEDVKRMIAEHYGEEAVKSLAPQRLPFVSNDEGELKVNNVFLAQTLANLFESQVVVGLEDVEDIDGERCYFSSALYFEPLKEGYYHHRRYEKQILVPMGEYIPFSFCRDLAARYGVLGSFTSGKKAVMWGNAPHTFGVSICYEELFGGLMRENRCRGANLLLNVTSDAWFPHSKLTRQHFEHARLRTVENGIPLIRACNTGVTGCVDALGQDVALLGEDDASREDVSDALYVSVPTYHYPTLYSQYGDRTIIGLSLLFCLFSVIPYKMRGDV